MIIFTYGTLPKFMVENDISFHILGVATIQGIKLEDTHWPAIIKPINNHSYTLTGQLIHLNNSTFIDILDEYEGDEYQREITQVTFEDNSTMDAYIYWYKLNGNYRQTNCEQI